MEPAHYLNIFRRRWKIIAGTMLASLLAGVAANVIAGPPAPPLFQADVIMTTEPPSSGTLRIIALMANSPEVAERANAETVLVESIEEYSELVDAVADRERNQVVITAFFGRPRPAERLANLVAQIVDERVAERFRPSSDQIEAQDEFADAITELNARAARLQQKADRLVARASGAEDAVALARLLYELRSMDGQRFALLRQQEAARIEASGPTVEAEIIATVPAVPVSPEGAVVPGTPVSRILFALVLGGGAGMLLAVGFEAFDRRLWDADIAAGRMHAELVAALPEVPEAVATAPLLAFGVPDHPLLGPVRGLLGTLASPTDGSPRITLVTSLERGEGKSTVAALLAVALAESGRRCLLISCDVASPRTQQLFGVMAEAPLNDRSQAVDLAVQKTDQGLLDVVVSRPEDTSVAAFLSDGRLRELLEKVGVEYADVVLDGTSLAEGDGALLVPFAEGLVLVIRPGLTQKGHVKRNAGLLGTLEPRPLAVANAVGSAQVTMRST